MDPTGMIHYPSIPSIPWVLQSSALIMMDQASPLWQQLWSLMHLILNPSLSSIMIDHALNDYNLILNAVS